MTEPTAAPTTADVVADAYVAGFPLVVTTRTLQILGSLTGVNQLIWQRQLAGPRYRVIVAPNRDTLYSSAVLDLRAEPMVLTLPDVVDRYFSYQLLDAWTESFTYIGTRTTDGQAGTWAITAPGWNGTLPDGVQRIEAPTPQIFLLGRFLVEDEEDVANVLAIAEHTSLRPLSELTGGATPDPPPALGTAPGSAQAVPSDRTFFAELAAALAVHPANTDEDRRRFHALAAAGVALDGDLDLDALDGELLAMLDEGAAQGRQRIRSFRDPRAEVIGGWSINRHIGTYGEDLLVRAQVALVAWAANVPEEAIYPLARTDATGAPLDGSRTYRLRFPPGGLPPVHAFWSLCAYDEDIFFAEHASGRYHIGDRTPHLVVGPDGSTEIVISHERPDGADREVGWLPVPEGPFRLMLRLYLPKPALLEGTYEYPPIEPV